jgi:hypothetical protein
MPGAAFFFSIPLITNLDRTTPVVAALQKGIKFQNEAELKKEYSRRLENVLYYRVQSTPFKGLAQNPIRTKVLIWNVAC